MAANFNVFKTSKKDCILSKSHFSFAEVHCVIYRIRQENKNFDDIHGHLKFTTTHSYPGWREALRVKCLAQKQNTMSLARA